MSSFDESKAAQLYFARSLSEKFVRHNRKYLSRVYPKGTRVFSSNFDPIPLWLGGCQMISKVATLTFYRELPLQS